VALLFRADETSSSRLGEYVALKGVLACFVFFFLCLLSLLEAIFLASKMLEILKREECLLFGRSLENVALKGATYLASVAK
jgi:hypothetical protein